MNINRYIADIKQVERAQSSNGNFVCEPGRPCVDDTSHVNKHLFFNEHLLFLFRKYSAIK